MMQFKIYNSDFGIKYNNVDYIFDHVDSMAIENPQFTRLTRGANATNKEGLIYTEGGKEPQTVTVTILGMTADMFALLRSIYQDKKRVDAVYCIDRADGSSKMGKNAILSQQPQQLTISEDAESLNVALVFQTFDMVEVHKS